MSTTPVSVEKFGIDEQEEDDILQMIPRRLTPQRLQAMSNVELVTIYNAVVFSLDYWHYDEHIESIHSKINRLWQEITKRKLDSILNRCEQCGTRLISASTSSILVAFCACTQTNNSSSNDFN